MTTHLLNQTKPYLNAFAQARLLISSNHRNANYQQQGIRHAYVIITINSSCDQFLKSSADHCSQAPLLNLVVNAPPMLTNTCRFLDRSQATRNVCQQQLQI
ncbi:putative galacturonosyltransferase-like 6 [Dorcoceras hygrometricum]|uniref:Putative galacturonosyltransferase-like 6 n=1 Tax=Dorcoceras hygrometricum TaxID=472368 RepID=A0A2Z7C4D3_9LAMI|nr:putative galacturonosyltransferase-like 6 [Dorcoceras hygrometricum]